MTHHPGRTQGSGDDLPYPPGNQVWATGASKELARELMASDIGYFRAGARSEVHHGFEILFMPGLTGLAAGCIALPFCSSDAPITETGLAAVEQRLRQLGAGHARLYLQEFHPALESLLIHRGYRAAGEIALLNRYQWPREVDAPIAGVELRAVMSEQDWADKVELHRAVPQGPDGHRSRADDWSEMERGKCRAGFMEPFLIIHRQQVCGSVNLASSGRLGRLKNLVIHPEWRRQGIGAGAAREIARLARDRGKPAAGCFAMEHGQAVGMYRNAGYFPVGRQTEWYRKLS